MITFSAGYVAAPLMIFGILIAMVSLLVPLEHKPRWWWIILGYLGGASLLGGIWILKSITS